jgi:hypothetical protein
MSNKDTHQNDDAIKGFGMILTRIPVLLFKSAGAFLRFKSDVKRAGKIFEKELLDQGIEKSVAHQLTQVYLDGGNIFKAFME